MTVENQFPYQSFTVNGLQTNFALGFYVDDKDHFEVKKNDQAVAKNDYSYNSSSNSIVFNTTPKQGDVIEVQRKTSADRATTYATYNNSFRPEVLNKDIDRIWLKIQELGVADQLLKIYTERLHNEQKDYLDNQDQIIRNIIADLRNYVNQQDNSLLAKIGELRSYTDQQDNSRHSYFENLIRQQGTALKQLDNYYKHLLIEIGKIASEKGWVASLVVDANGRNQQQINDNSTYFYATVADMVSDPYLKDGVIVGTKGYYQQHDDGGAIYLISITPTDYSIPLDNGLHAIFRDTFDIKKFGIVSNPILDQTVNLTRMIKYADSRIYEIDFHNFEIMTPETYYYTTGRGAEIRGMGFFHVHHIKNLKIANNKTKQLVSGTCPIHFLPIVDGEGVFELTNVTFDPYNSDFKLVSGEMDGYLCGFNAFWHQRESVNTTSNALNPSGYSFKFTDIHFKSPAISYNLGDVC